MSTVRAGKSAVVGEHEFEASHGLPEELPEGEEVLWQGSSDWRGLARRVFFTRIVATYFAVVLLWRVGGEAMAGGTLLDLLASTGWILLPAASALSLLFGIAWLHHRVTVYTITNRRVAIRMGVALTITVNLPYRAIQSADLVRHSDGTGDLVLDVTDAAEVGYVMMWPHVASWRLGANVRPAMRCIQNVDEVAQILAKVLVETESARVIDGARSAYEGTADFADCDEPFLNAAAS